MMFRTRLLLIVTVAIVAAVGTVGLLVQGTTRRAFEKVEAQRASALTQQFQKEFQRRGQEFVRAVNAIAASNIRYRLAFLDITLSLLLRAKQVRICLSVVAGRFP